MSNEDKRLIALTNCEALPAHVLLRQAVGKRLASVHYYILPGEFNIDEPNESGGCQVVRLVFEGGFQIAFDWVAEPDLREDGPNYRMHLSSGVAQAQAVRIWTQSGLKDKIAETNGMMRLEASTSRIWRSLVGQTLQVAPLLGVADRNEELCSPQAVSLQFATGTVFVSIGMTNYLKSATIGDGDEVLVFDGPEWKGALSLSPYWNLITYESGAQSERP